MKKSIVLFCLLPFAIKAVNYQAIDPSITTFLKDLAGQDGPPIYTLPPQKARKILEDLQASSVDTVPAHVKDYTIGNKKKPLSFRIIRPAHSSVNQKLPIILYMHGGGWILGSKNTHDRFIRQIANGTQAAVVFVNYTPAPEAHYPVQLEQGYAILDHIASNADKYQLDGSRIALVGDSVGGCMVAVLARWAQERKGPAITYQVLLYPVTDANFNTHSYKEFADGYWLSKKSMEWFWDAYAPAKVDRKNPDVAPLQASIVQLRNLPPALVLVNETDVLRDEGQAYAHKLAQAGVPVKGACIFGAIHDLLLLDPIKNTAPAQFALEITIMELKRVLR